MSSFPHRVRFSPPEPRGAAHLQVTSRRVADHKEIERVLAVQAQRRRSCSVHLLVNDVLVHSCERFRFAGSECADEFFARFVRREAKRAWEEIAETGEEWRCHYVAKSIDKSSIGITLAANCRISDRVGHYEFHCLRPNFESTLFQDVPEDRTLRESVRIFDERLSREDLDRSYTRMNRPSGACAHCGGVEGLKACSCNLVRYCSKACQKASWPTHKAECKRQGSGPDVRTQHQSLQERFNADDVDWDHVDANGTRIQIVDFEGVHVYGMSGSSTD